MVNGRPLLAFSLPRGYNKIGAGMDFAMTYAPIDIFFLIIVLFFAIAAAAHGLVREFFGKAAFIVGIIAAIFFTPRLEPFVRDGVKNALLAKVAAFLVIFVIAFLAVKIVQTLVAKIFSGEIMKGLDRALGFLFGVVEGLAVVALVLLALNVQPWFQTDSLLDESLFARLLGGVVNVSADALGGISA